MAPIALSFLVFLHIMSSAKERASIIQSNGDYQLYLSRTSEAGGEKHTVLLRSDKEITAKCNL